MIHTLLFRFKVLKTELRKWKKAKKKKGLVKAYIEGLYGNLSTRQKCELQSKITNNGWITEQQNVFKYICRIIIVLHCTLRN